jgi:MFS family permease
MSELGSVKVTSGMRRLLGSEVASNFGSMLSRLAIPWIAALVLQATPLQMAWLVIADVAAGAAGTLIVGGLVDRLSRRVVMIFADILRAASVVVIVVLFAFDALSFWMLAVQASVNGIFGMAFSVARSAWIADNVPDGALTRRNAQMSAASSASESLAFASGGWIYQLLGPLVALVTDALSYVASALFVRSLPERTVQAAPGGSRKAFYSDAAQGFGIVRADPVLRALVVSDVLMTISFSITGAAYMIFVSRDLALAPGIQGLVFASGAFGSLAGAAMAQKLGRAMGAPKALAAGLFAAGLGAACIPLAPGAGVVGIALLVAHQVIGDSGSVVAMIHGRTLRQLHAPPGWRGRVDAAMRSVSQAVTLAAALGGGWLATTMGTRVALWLSAFCLLLAAPVLLALFKNVAVQQPEHEQ